MERNTGRQTLRECDMAVDMQQFQTFLDTYSDRKTVRYNYTTLERNSNLSLVNESCCYHRKLHVTLTGMQDPHTHTLVCKHTISLGFYRFHLLLKKNISSHISLKNTQMIA